MTTLTLLVIAVPFILIAGLMAFIITWNEYQKHQFKGRRLFMEALRAAVFTIIVFALLSVGISFFLEHFITGK